MNTFMAFPHHELPGSVFSASLGVFFTGQAEPRTISLHFVPQTLPFLDSFQVDNFPQDTNGLEDLFCDSTSEYLTKYSLVLVI